MQKSTRRNLLIALAVVLVIAVIAYWWITTRGMVKFLVTGVSPASGAAGNYTLTFTGTTKSTVDASKWVNQPVHIFIKSLGGKLKSTVASASVTDGAGTVSAQVTLSSALSYTPDPSDHIRIFIKPKSL